MCDINTDILNPRIKAYTGWANYKNVKSGNYNRQECWNCSTFKGFPQTPGVYNLNITNTPPPVLCNIYPYSSEYQRRRMSNYPGKFGTQYVNYLNEKQLPIPLHRYIKGFWPDEKYN